MNIIDLFLSPFMFHALVAGLALSMVTGPLGCFVVWRRMSYFGDTMAHAGLLGVSLSLLVDLPLSLGVFVVAMLLAFVLTILTRDHRLQTDTALGILAHGTLALSLVVISLTLKTNVDLMRYLFGDILSLGMDDLMTVLVASAGIVIALLFNWRRLVLFTIDPSIAKIEGLPVRRIHLLMMVLLALVIAVAIKLVGILLITALLIIPAATSRFWAKSPSHMAMLASVVGSLSVAVGLITALAMDTPAAPTIVVVALGLFSVSWVLRRRY